MLFFPPRWGPHANRRKRKYGITERQIAFTWLYGESHIDRMNCWRLVGEEVSLVLDPLQMFIITLFPNRYKDKFIARNARMRRADGNVRIEWLNGFYDPAQLRDRCRALRIAYVFCLDKVPTSSYNDWLSLANTFDLLHRKETTNPTQQSNL